MFTDIEWGTVSELTASLLEFAMTKKASPDTSQDKFLETERRWLAKDGPGLIRRVQYERNHSDTVHLEKSLHKCYVEAWLCTANSGLGGEIRIHRTFSNVRELIGNYICYKTGFKDPSGLTREKYEFITPEINFDRILKLIVNDLTIKPFRGSIVVPVDLWVLRYSVGNSTIEYEIRSADNGNRVWIDVEFPTEEAAKAFELQKQYLRFIDREITNDPSETMASYWYRTRVHPYIGT